MAEAKKGVKPVKNEKKEEKKKIEEREADIQEKISVIEEEFMGGVFEEQDDLDKELEIKQGFRIIRLPDSRFHIHHPSIAIENEAITLRGEKLTEYAGKYPPVRKLRAQLKKDGIWTQEDDDSVKDMRKELREGRYELEKEKMKSQKIIVPLNEEAERLKVEEDRIEAQPKKSKKDLSRLDEIKDKVQILRDKIADEASKMTELSYDFAELYTDFTVLMSEKLGYELSSLENQLESQTIYYKIINCVFKVNDKKKETPVWKTIDAFMNEKDVKLAQKVLAQATDFWKGGDPSFFEN